MTSRQEATYRWSIATGDAEFVGCGLGRNYERGNGWVYGTIDVDGMGFVADYKFEGCETHTEPVQSNPQMLFAAMCKAKVERWAKVTAALIHFKPDGSHWLEEAKFDALDLDIFEAALRKCIANVREAEEKVAAGQTPDVRRGDWCRYCGAAASCPAVTSLIRAVALEPVRTAEEIRAALTPATARAAYLRLQEVKAALAPVSAALHMYADEFPIDLGDGYVYGARESRREKVDGRKAREVLAEMFSPEVAISACKFTTSKSAISKAVGAVAKAAKAAGQRATGKALVEAALAEIAKAGGITESVTRKVSRHRADGTDADESDGEE